MILLILVGGIYLYKTYALYEEKKEFNVLKGIVPDFSTLKVKYIVNGVETSLPSKTDEYIQKGITCSGVSNYSWDNTNWKVNYSLNYLTNKNVSCTVTFVKLYIESTLNGAEPVLGSGMVPVVIETNGVVKKANTKEEWYSYANKKWANAVILTGEDTYQDGDTIPEKNIESYFVWIPKYSYKIQSLGTNTTPKAFEIRFGLTNTSDSKNGECTTPGWNEKTKTYDGSKVSGSSGNCKVGDYMTHPAFLNYKEETKGIWVGKFETTGTTSSLTVKPNITSIRGCTVNDMYNAAIKFNSNLNSHMIKNTEWGAVAYLTNSDYGRCISGICTEVAINSSYFLTGYTNSSTSYFNGSVLASTTGNYSGIYDMNGGAWEYVMGNYNSTIGSSGISSFPASKYYDKYTNSTEASRILGDATAETYNWNNDLVYFINAYNPWFIRGGYYPEGSGSGIFAYYLNPGNGLSWQGGCTGCYTFRLSLIN